MPDNFIRCQTCFSMTVCCHPQFISESYSSHIETDSSPTSWVQNDRNYWILLNKKIFCFAQYDGIFSASMKINILRHSERSEESILQKKAILQRTNCIRTTPLYQKARQERSRNDDNFRTEPPHFIYHARAWLKRAKNAGLNFDLRFNYYKTCYLRPFFFAGLLTCGISFIRQA